MRKFVIMLMLAMLSIGASAQGLFVEGGLGLSAPVKDGYKTYFHGQITVGMAVSSKALLGVEYTNSSFSEPDYDFSLQTVGLKAYIPFIAIPQLDVDFIVGAGYGWDSYRDDYYDYDHLSFFVPKAGIDVMFNLTPSKSIQAGFGGEYAHYILTDSHEYGENISNFNIAGKLRIMF